MCRKDPLQNITKPPGALRKPSTLFAKIRGSPGFSASTVSILTTPFDPPVDYLKKFDPAEMPLPSEHPEEKGYQAKFPITGSNLGTQ